MSTPVAPQPDNRFDPTGAGRLGVRPDETDPDRQSAYPQQPDAPQSYAQGSYAQGSYAHPDQPYADRLYPAQRAAEDPGKVLGIISLVATLSTFIGFNFIGPAIGIVTGYMARRASKEAGFGDNEFGKWGFILGLVFIGIAVVGAVLGVSISMIVAMMS
ncbi:DUF4190 domain-containing protein [Brevibacterium sp. 2SA]|uniref:DUF4190 domain-containing protein n=1 Tax=Brevibacterium sp. 2SA TaxID=2502198 RepID=UPI0010F71D6D|nr:DUF4190 domain-containing protein [Brevibacterium sp. 2SA]